MINEGASQLSYRAARARKIQSTPSGPKMAMPEPPVSASAGAADGPFVAAATVSYRRTTCCITALTSTHPQGAETRFGAAAVDGIDEFKSTNAYPGNTGRCRYAGSGWTAAPVALPVAYLEQAGVYSGGAETRQLMNVDLQRRPNSLNWLMYTDPMLLLVLNTSLSDTPSSLAFSRSMSMYSCSVLAAQMWRGEHLEPTCRLGVKRFACDGICRLLEGLQAHARADPRFAARNGLAEPGHRQGPNHGHLGSSSRLLVTLFSVRYWMMAAACCSWRPSRPKSSRMT